MMMTTMMIDMWNPMREKDNVKVLCNKKMDKVKVRKIRRYFNLFRIIMLILFLLFLFAGICRSQDYKPQWHGILRGKYEYSPALRASRFEVRNARISASGKLPMRSEYKLEVDLCDESEIKMKDAWVSVTPWQSLRISLGQQRMPFSIDAHRNPSVQYFANRSFIAKQVGDMRDVGGMIGYTFYHKHQRPLLIADAGIFNGSSLNEQKDAWFTELSYSARLQFFPVEGLALVPSIQHQSIARRQVFYTSLDFGVYYEIGGWHVEGEFLHKTYQNDAFSDCRAVDAMVIYRRELRSETSFVQAVSWLGRYDYMGDHSSGKKGFEVDVDGLPTTRLAMTDAERHRMTLGTTLSLRNKYYPTDLRLNYEKYWYPHEGAKEGEQDKLVVEVAVRF